MASVPLVLRRSQRHSKTVGVPVLWPRHDQKAQKLKRELRHLAHQMNQMARNWQKMLGKFGRSEGQHEPTMAKTNTSAAKHGATMAIARSGALDIDQTCDSHDTSTSTYFTMPPAHPVTSTSNHFKIRQVTSRSMAPTTAKRYAKVHLKTIHIRVTPSHPSSFVTA